MSCPELTTPESSNDKVFTNCVIREKRFNRQTYTKCVFRQVSFKKCVFDRIKFIECEFYDVRFGGADFYDTEFVKTKLENCNFKNSTLIGAKFEETTIKNSNLRNADLQYSVLTDVEMIGVDMTAAFLMHAKSKDTVFTNTIFAGTSFPGAILTSVDFTGADLSRADFTNTEIVASIFQNANLSHANFTDTETGTTIFQNANLTRVNFTNSNLTDVNFADANLTDVNFNRAKLTRINSTGATGVDFTEAHMIITPEVSDDLNDFDIHSDDGSDDDSVEELTTIPTTGLIKRLSPSYKAIPRDQIGFHIFDMEVQVFEYLKSTEGIDAVAFLYYSTYYLIDKSTLTKLIDRNYNLKSMVYSNNESFMKVESIGIPLRFSYIPIPYIEYILKTSNKIEDRMFELVSTDEKIKTYDGDRGLLFKLKNIKNAGNIVLNTIRRVASANKTKKNKVGGRKTTRHISKKSKVGSRKITRQVYKHGGRRITRRI